MEADRVNEVAAWIDEFHKQNALNFLSCPVQELKETIKHLEEKLSREQSIGCLLAPQGWQNRQDGIHFRIERLKAIVQLVEVYRKSEETIKKISERKNNEMALAKALGMVE